MCESVRKAESRNHHHLLDSQLVDETNSYKTKAFLIRYAEEEVEIEETVLFRAEIDTSEEQQDFYISFTVYFADL